MLPPYENALSMILQILVQRAAVEDDAHTAVQPQHGKRHCVDTAVDIGKSRKMLHVNGKGIGKYQPANACQQRAGDGIPESVPPVGQKGKHQGKYQRLDAQQQKEPEIDDLRQEIQKRHIPVRQQRQKRGPEHMQHQGQQQHQDKQEGIQDADKPGVEKSPVFTYTVNGIQAR